MKLNGHFRGRKKADTAKKATKPKKATAPKKKKKKITIPKPVEPAAIPLAPPAADPEPDKA